MFSLLPAWHGMCFILIVNQNYYTKHLLLKENRPVIYNGVLVVRLKYMFSLFKFSVMFLHLTTILFEFINIFLFCGIFLAGPPCPSTSSLTESSPCPSRLECRTFSWVALDWDPCLLAPGVTCGTGKQRRQIKCQSEGREVEDSWWVLTIFVIAWLQSSDSTISVSHIYFRYMISWIYFLSVPKRLVLTDWYFYLFLVDANVMLIFSTQTNFENQKDISSQFLWSYSS